MPSRLPRIEPPEIEGETAGTDLRHLSFNGRLSVYRQVLFPQTIE
jgi:hypothetical protein